MKLLKITALTLILVSCGKRTVTETKYINPPAKPLPSIVGEYGNSSCFYNRHASEGFGSAVYSVVSQKFNADGTGLNTFELFTDATCTTSALNGSAEFTYELLKQDNDQVLIRLSQDQGVGNPRLVLNFIGILYESALVVDIDGGYGPYLDTDGQSVIDNAYETFKSELNIRATVLMRQ